MSRVKSISKKLLSVTLAIVLLVTFCVSMAGCQKDEPTELVKVRVAHHMGWTGAVVSAVGVNKGYFKDAGFDVELVPFTSGPNEIAAMVSGDLQFGYIGSGATTLAVKGDVEVFMFQSLGDADIILTSSDTGIKSVADLKGKTLATTLGTTAETLVDLAFKRAGVERGDGANQCSVINMDQSGCVTAMLAGQVDAVAVYGTFRVTVETQLGDKKVVLGKTSDFGDETAAIASWLCTPEYLEQNPELVEKFAEAVVRSLDYIAGNEEEIIPWVAEIINAKEDVVRAQISTVRLWTGDEILEDLNNGNLANYYMVQQQAFYDTGKIDKMVDLGTYVHWDIMKQAVTNTRTTK